MNYTISKIWEMMNSEDEEIRKNADILYEQWVEEDNKNLKSIKPYLSDLFWDIMEDEEFLHDYFIDNITVRNLKRNKIKILMNISKRNKKFSLIFKNVLNYEMDVKDVEYFIGKMGIGYIEIYRINELWEITITCDITSVLKIVCSDFNIDGGKMQDCF